MNFNITYANRSYTSAVKAKYVSLLHRFQVKELNRVSARINNCSSVDVVNIVAFMRLEAYGMPRVRFEGNVYILLGKEFQNHLIRFLLILK